LSGENPNLKILNAIEDLSAKLDAILAAMILPNLGKNKREIATKIGAQIKSELGRNIWNSINGQRTLAEIGILVKRKPQVVLRYIKRWEQENPPLVYVCSKKDANKIYRRIFELNLKKPKSKTKIKEVARTPTNQPISS
jgi:hypothetical protein